MTIKTVAICGSMRVVEAMVKSQTELEAMGWKALVPAFDEPTDYSVMSIEDRSRIKSGLIWEHINLIKQSDSILIVNETAGDRVNYIGANSFLEMGFALLLGKTIYLLNPIPDQPNSDEIYGMLPVILDGDLAKMV